MRKIKLVMLVAMTTISAYSYAQVGINTSDPKASLDVVGNPTNTTKLDGILPPRLTGDQLRAKTYTTAQTGAQVYVTAADSNPSGQTIYVKTPGSYYFNGTVWKLVLGVESVLPNGTGSVIMINGVIQVAQEMALRMQQDFIVPVNNTIVPIGNITNKLIDNFNGFTGTSTTNSFKVKDTGTYLIGMNFPLQNQSSPTLSGNFYYGLYNDTDSRWVAFSIYTINNMANGEVKDISYLAAMDLDPAKTYSFRANQAGGDPAVVLKIRGLAAAAGGGNFEVGYFSVKRLK